MGLLDGLKEYLRERHEAVLVKIERAMLGKVNELARQHEFYETNNDFYTNERVFLTHKRYIDSVKNSYRGFLTKYCSTEEIEGIIAHLKEPAELWHQFRTEGLKMSRENLNRLIELEEDSPGGNILKLREMMASLEANERMPLKPKVASVDLGKTVPERVPEISSQKKAGMVR